MVMGAQEFPARPDEIRKFGGRARRVSRVPTRPPPLVHSFVAAVRSRTMREVGEKVEGARGGLWMSEWVIMATGKIPDGGGHAMTSVGNLSSGSAPSGREIGTSSMAADPSEVGRTIVGEGGLISEGTLRTGGDLKFNGNLRI
jgi:hypothetical protein